MKFDAMCKTILRRTYEIWRGSSEKILRGKKVAVYKSFGRNCTCLNPEMKKSQDTIPLGAKPPHPPHVEHICITFSLYLSPIFLFSQFVYSSGGSSRYLVVERPALSDILLGQVPTSFTPHTSVANSTRLGIKKIPRQVYSFYPDQMYPVILKMSPA